MFSEPTDVSVSLLSPGGRPNRTIRAVAIGWLAILLAGLWAAEPYLSSTPVICLSRWVLHLPCPGCGMTRALAAAAHGKWRAAAEFHPLWVLTLSALVVGWVFGIGYTYRGWRIRPHTVAAIVATGAVSLIAVWVVRMVIWARQGELPAGFGAP
ncbi:DUF2752 domain-containing protein [Candidatus Poribacteria bacterium]|nr:DUF2752 domain-containing protein [Candidatus Poribacteria bacterium]